MATDEYIFPFKTCEKTNKEGIAQPYSSFFNLISCLIIFYFLLKTKEPYNFIFIFSIFCFQLFHLFSHMIHIEGNIQTNIIHGLAYFINISLFNALYSYTNKLPNYSFMTFLGLIVCFDLYSLFNLSTFYYVLTQTILLVSLLMYYYSSLPKSIQNNIYKIIGAISVAIILFLNENINCQRMLSYSDFPFHILPEISLIVVFYLICSNFYSFTG
jgi:hypothetical protein